MQSSRFLHSVNFDHSHRGTVALNQESAEGATTLGPPPWFDSQSVLPSETVVSVHAGATDRFGDLTFILDVIWFIFPPHGSLFFPSSLWPPSSYTLNYVEMSLNIALSYDRDDGELELVSE